jgi:heat shock protein HspQ
MKANSARFAIGQVVKHRLFAFRGLIFDVDPEFDNTEDWWLSIPEDIRPSKEQPFYHLFAENAETEYVAYVSEQNLLPDTSGEPLRNALIEEMFDLDESGAYRTKPTFAHLKHHRGLNKKRRARCPAFFMNG